MPGKAKSPGPADKPIGERWADDEKAPVVVLKEPTAARKGGKS